MKTAQPDQTSTYQYLPESLQKIAHQLKESPPGNPGEMRKIVMEANVQAGDLVQWSDFEHPVSDSYGRKLVYKADNFEIMVMSWRPGDFSTIHDHGYTQWGAVQVFGPAEHATFRYDEEGLMTLARWRMKPGDVVGVSHHLVHQMGNPTPDKFFLSLHVYGTYEAQDNVTGEARLFDLENGQIHRVNGGVFFALPESEYVSSEPGAMGDFPTHLRHMVELSRRLGKMKTAGIELPEGRWEEVIFKTFDASQKVALWQKLVQVIDENGHVSDSIQWRILNCELKNAAAFQRQVEGVKQSGDSFMDYARMYDELICQPCMDSFMRRYLFFFQEKFGVDFSSKSLISLGCGTGLVEKFMMDELGLRFEQCYGIDISEAMINEARKRIQADVGDILGLDPSVKTWDIAFSGLNVLQYLPARKLGEAISKIAAILEDGGYFVGDFITPDHIRWYPNLMSADEGNIVSLRTPELIEEGGINYQESEIINLDFGGKQMKINYAGKHKRYLPALYRMRQLFGEHFQEVSLYDATSLAEIPEWADSCASTRYVVVARKG
ncbi:MAG: hypothetical protein CMN32_02265 [Saprospirales bacterium]|nr:hypothetical protein [Saprospirales bacterium]